MSALLRHTKAILYALVFLGIILVSYFASQHDRFPGDLEIAQGVQKISSSLFDNIMYTITVSGAKTPALGLVFLCIAALWVFRYRLEAVFVALVPVFDLSHYVFNWFVNRPIPTNDLVRVWDASDWLDIAPGSIPHYLVFWGGTRTESFPSGHVLHSVLLFGFLFYLVSTQVKRRFTRIALQILFIFLILASGLARIYLGIHWFSDVVGGYLIGGLLLAILIVGYKKCRRWLQLDDQAVATWGQKS
jgi:undecaprenyl-diphosphatase